MKDGFWFEITHVIDRPLIYKFFSLNKVVFSSRYEFLFDFPLFLSLTCCDLWLFVSFCICYSDSNTTSIIQKNQIKYLFISMFS